MSTSVIYLDSNSTTPVLPLAQSAACSAMTDDYGNPSSVHSSGIQAKAVMDSARQKACEILGCANGRLLFVSGATEGIQTAIFSALIAIRERRAKGEKVGNLLLYGATEHKAIPESLHHWNSLLQLNLEIRVIPVNREGLHDLEFLRTHAGESSLICTMAANNETGVISDLIGIEAILKDLPTYWLVDSVQALGKLSLKLSQHRIDYAPFSGHKLYAPKGIGMLYVHNNAPFTPLLAGGGQESSLRSGTENVSGIAALGAVLNALDDGKTFRTHDTLIKLRLQLLEAMKEAFPGLILNAPLENTLPTTLNFSVPGLTSKELLDLFDAADIRVSAGSACSAAKALPSFVLQAMNLEDWRTSNAVRVSFGPAVTKDYIDEACRRVRACGEALRRTCMVSGSIEPLPAEGVIQLNFGDACTWIIADALSKSCVVIDPLPQLIERIAKYVHCQTYSVLAILDTHSHDNQVDHSQRLVNLLGKSFIGNVENTYFSKSILESTLLVDSHQVIRFGDKSLMDILPKNSSFSSSLYLISSQNEGSIKRGFKAQFALCGDIKLDTDACLTNTGIHEYITNETLLCLAHDLDHRFVASLKGNCDVCVENFTVRSNTIEDFINQHPGTILVDVREPYEQEMSHFTLPKNVQLLHMPLSRLANGVEHWLKQASSNQAPLLFFCRTGGRSSQAVQCLRRLGYDHAWHLGGGLALWQRDSHS
jgi:cysteine desulfurase